MHIEVEVINGVSYKDLPTAAPNDTHLSLNLNPWPLVHQILINAPCHNITQPFPHYSRSYSSEITNHSIIFVDLQYCLSYSLVVLGSVFIVVLKEYPGSDDIKWVRNDAAHEVGCDRRHSRDRRNIESPLFVVLIIRVELKETSIELLAQLINWIEYPWKRDISQQGDLQPGEKPPHSLVFIDFHLRIKEIWVFLEPQHFQPGFNNYQRVAQDGLKCTG